MRAVTGKRHIGKRDVRWRGVAVHSTEAIVDQVTEILDVQNQLQVPVTSKTDFLDQPQAHNADEIGAAGVASHYLAALFAQATFAIDETVQVVQEVGVAGNDRVAGACWHIEQVRTGVVTLAAEIGQERAAKRPAVWIAGKYIGEVAP